MGFPGPARRCGWGRKPGQTSRQSDSAGGELDQGANQPNQLTRAQRAPDKPVLGARAAASHSGRSGKGGLVLRGQGPEHAQEAAVLRAPRGEHSASLRAHRLERGGRAAGRLSRRLVVGNLLRRSSSCCGKHLVVAAIIAASRVQMKQPSMQAAVGRAGRQGQLRVRVLIALDASVPMLEGGA
jgi:hypothetical protein